MPNDTNGNSLVVGDIVTLQAKVLGLYNIENDGCNITLQVVGEAQYKPVLVCSPKLVSLKLPEGTFSTLDYTKD